MPPRASHSWEEPECKRGKHSWESASQASTDAADSDLYNIWGEWSDSDDESGPPTPGEELVQKILYLHMVNKITAEDCCTTMHLAQAAGIKEAAPYSLKPGQSSGHYSKKLKEATGHTDNSPHLYQFTYPGNDKHSLSRTVHSGHCIPLHEQVAEDLQKNVGCRERLSALLSERAFPPIYYDHPIVKAHPGENVLPLAIYLDAVPWSINDSVVGWWAMNLVTGKRYLWGVLRKEVACKCGCKGWDSLYAFHSLLVWFLEALADAQFPAVRHDGSAFTDAEQHRQERAGSRIRLRCCCIFVKGDWSEFSSSLGLPNWGDALRACYCCNAFGADLFVGAGHQGDKLRWRPNEHDDYESACQRCMTVVEVSTEALRDRIASRLRYDKRTGAAGSKGRALVASVPGTNLLAEDRLEPTMHHPDVGSFEASQVPFSATFWRPSEESLTRRPNPLFLSRVGVSAAKSLAIDTLHTVYLGVMKVWARIAVWAILISGVFGEIGHSEEHLKTAMLPFRASLMKWYKTRHAAFPKEKLTRMGDWSVKVVGTRAHPKLKSKGAETYGLLLYLLDMLALYKVRLGSDWQRLQQSGSALARIVEIWSSCGWTIPSDLREDLKKQSWCLCLGWGWFVVYF